MFLILFKKNVLNIYLLKNSSIRMTGTYLPNQKIRAVPNSKRFSEKLSNNCLYMFIKLFWKQFGHLKIL